MEPETLNVLNDGVAKVIAYDNIAITVLMIVAAFEALFIAVLVRGLLKTKDVLAEVAKTIAILNERLHHHGDD